MSDRTKCVEEHRRRSNGPLTCEDCRAAAIAAAEERGRRAGIEARDELQHLDELQTALGVIEILTITAESGDLALAARAAHEIAKSSDIERRLRVRIAALAPRDSGKVTASELLAAVERKP